jgi:hypothetical protein
MRDHSALAVLDETGQEQTRSEISRNGELEDQSPVEEKLGLTWRTSSVGIRRRSRVLTRGAASRQHHTLRTFSCIAIRV